MARYVATIRTAKPIEEAFDYLADFSSVAEWDPSAVRAERLSAAPGPGAEFRVVVRFAGREIPFTYRTIEFRRPARVVLVAEGPTVVSEDTMTFTEKDGVTEVTYDANLRPKGLMRLAGPLLGLLFRRLGDNAAAGLRRELGELGG
jgi:uncharacterized protein YndB with AHSA1/START domain